MPDRHKTRQLQFRPPEDDRNWLLAHAKATGQAISAILTAALKDYRAKSEPAGKEGNQDG